MRQFLLYGVIANESHGMFIFVLQLIFHSFGEERLARARRQVVRFNQVMNIKNFDDANQPKNQHGIETGGGVMCATCSYNNSVSYNVRFRRPDR